MREILFRGKRKDDGQWKYGDLLQIPSNNLYTIRDQTPVAFIEHIDPETVGQFTGLYNKNGTKIFEGDILKSHYDDAFPEDYTLEEIVFNDCAWCTRQVGYDNCNPREDGDFAECSEVVGNIYDNPEILKGGTE